MVYKRYIPGELGRYVPTKGGVVTNGTARVVAGSGVARGVAVVVRVRKDDLVAVLGDEGYGVMVQSGEGLVLHDNVTVLANGKVPIIVVLCI